ncbi:MAG TPA: glycosyltransferase [Vicinamibacterales bacterium]|nr:glycosyltransferase [Vicinamibacterales bacterium]
MRALLSTIGSRGDVTPLVALAVQLRALGHEARLCVPPDFRDWIESCGLEVVPIGPSVRAFAASRPPASQTPLSPPSPDQLRQIIDATVATQFETITAAAEGCDVILAATALQVAAGSVAEKMGIPYVFAAYAPIVFPSLRHAPAPLPPAAGETPAPANADNRELWARSDARTNATFRDALNAHRTARGLAAVDDVRSYMFTARPWLAADPTLAPWPEPDTESVFQPGAWIVPDEQPLPRDVDAFLDGGAPPIFFGFGSARVAQGAGAASVEAARALGRRGIVSSGWSDLSGEAHAADCLTVGEANFQALFPRVAAVVHHGGAGTTTLATLAGTPQVIVPQVYDQHYFARRVVDLGVGSAHAPGAMTAESLTAALEQTLRPEVAARAKSVGTRVRRDGAQIAAEALYRASSA